MGDEGRSDNHAAQSVGGEIQAAQTQKKAAQLLDVLNSVFKDVASTMKMPNFRPTYSHITEGKVSEETIAAFYYVSCLQGEAGEAFQVVQHAVRKCAPVDKAKLESELVDQLWFIRALVDVLDLDLVRATERKCEELRGRISSGYYDGGPHGNESTSSG